MKPFPPNLAGCRQAEVELCHDVLEERVTPARARVALECIKAVQQNIRDERQFSELDELRAVCERMERARLGADADEAADRQNLRRGGH